MDLVVGVVVTYVVPILAIPGAASVAAALLRRPAPDSTLGKVFKVIDILAFNWMNARNAKP